MRVRIEENVLDALTRLRSKDAQRVIRLALTSSVRILRKESISNFKRNGRTKSGKKIDMGTAGLVRASRLARRQLGMKVHIMGNPLARIFEKGAVNRHTMVARKKYTSSRINNKGDRVRITYGRGRGHYTGDIIPIHFFRDARTAKEKEIYETFNKQVRKVFKDLWEQGKIHRR